MKETPGEDVDHPHHRSLWFAHSDVNGIDFWNEGTAGTRFPKGAIEHETLVETISAVNRYLADNIPSNRFVTLFYAELDPESGAVSFLNAGHNPPLIVHAAGTVEQLASGGLPLGIKGNAEYREGRTTLQPGDVLVIYSDGVTEAASPSGEEFGPTRLYEVVSRNVDSSAAGIRDRIESALTKFSQGTQAADDITLVIVKRQAATRTLSISGAR